MVVNQTDTPIPIELCKKTVHSNLKCTATQATFLKIRSAPTDGELKAQKKECLSETENTEFQAPAVLNRNRNLTVENSHVGSSSDGMQLPLPTLDLPNSQHFSEMREEDGQLAESL